jgi:transposase
LITFNRRTKIFVCKDPTDMRASYDTLFSRAKVVLNQDPFSGHLFLFINGKRSSIKCLYYDGTGFVILMKRLEKGLFSRINPMFKGEVILTAAEFALFFEGADLEKRFIESPREIKKSTFPVSQELQQATI